MGEGCRSGRGGKPDNETSEGSGMVGRYVKISPADGEGSSCFAGPVCIMQARAAPAAPGSSSWIGGRTEERDGRSRVGKRRKLCGEIE